MVSDESQQTDFEHTHTQNTMWENNNRRETKRINESKSVAFQCRITVLNALNWNHRFCFHLCSAFHFILFIVYFDLFQFSLTDFFGACLFLFVCLLIGKWLRVLFIYFSRTTRNTKLNWIRGKNSFCCVSVRFFCWLMSLNTPSHLIMSRALNQSREEEKNHYTDTNTYSERARECTDELWQASKKKQKAKKNVRVQEWMSERTIQPYNTYVMYICVCDYI